MKSVRIIFIVSTSIGLLSIGVVASLMLWGPDHIDFNGKTLSQLFGEGELWGLIIIPVVIVISAVALLPFLRIIFPAQINNGVTARARVLKIWDTGVSINDNPQVGLLLEVTPPTGTPFQAEAKTVVSRLNTSLVQPGTAAEVKYDPQKPQRLQVVSLQVSEAAPGSTAARLEELARLHDQALITGEEYRRKREEILNNLVSVQSV